MGAYTKGRINMMRNMGTASVLGRMVKGMKVDGSMEDSMAKLILPVQMVK